MKQGRGNSSRGDMKVEPMSKAKNPAKAASIGLQQVRTRPHTDLGRGFTAPAPAAQKTHKSGSQGKR